jgi:FMN reductase
MDEPTRAVVFATSLNPGSRSWRLAVEAHRVLASREVDSSLVDLRDSGLPQTGPPEAYDHPEVRRLRSATARASHVVIAVPVYNYQVASTAKGLVELLGREALGGKTIALMCSAGGRGSFMAPMAFANSLMLDFRCWIVPRFVYTVPDDYGGDGEITNPEVVRRVETMIDDLLGRR